jgi:acid phosphatase family membrane protein YuiD
MKNYFTLKLTFITLLLSGVMITTHAQDSVKKVVVKKAVNAAITKPANGVPINPKTGKPYTKYGYGSYSKTYKEQQTADSLKAAAQKTSAVVAAPAVAKADTTPHVDKSLSGQYHYLLTKVYNYQQPFVGALWKNVMDTLNNTRKQLKDANEKLTAQTKTIGGMQSDMSTKEQTLTTATAKADSISFVGIDLTKTTYNLIMWGLVIVVGIIAGIVIAQSGGYRREAVHRTTLFNELDEEFKAYKVKANEKEKKLARELQTERNKVDELSGRG